MPGKIFISYRRGDTRADARSVEQRLRHRFGNDSVFLDVDTILKGRDFRKVLTEALASSSVLLAMIGPNWLGTPDDNGRRRIDDPNDLVRVEIATALKRDIPVIPVLVGGAKMPSDIALPDDIRELAYRQAATIAHENFGPDMEAIERDIVELIGDTYPPGYSWFGMPAAAAVVALVAMGAIWFAAPHFGIAVPGLRAPSPTTKPADALQDPTRLTADREKAEAEALRLAAAEERSKVLARQKAEEEVRQRKAAALAAAARAEEERLKVERTAAATTAEMAQSSVRLAAAKKAADDIEARRKLAEELTRQAPIEEEALRRARAEWPGQVIFVWAWPDMDDDCRVLGLPDMQVVSQPKLGTILFISQEFTFRYTRIKAREKCIGRTITGRRGYYLAKPGDLQGNDFFSIRQRSSIGTSIWEFEYDGAKRSVTMKNVTTQ